MTQKERLESLEAQVAALQARLAAVEARPQFYPYWPQQTWFGNTPSTGPYTTCSVNSGGTL